MQSCCRLKAHVTQSEWTARPYPPCKPSGFSTSLLQIFSSICHSKAWFPYDRYDHCHRWEREVQRSQRQQSLRQSFFYLNDRCRCDPRCDRWRVVSIWSLRSLNLFFFFFLTIAANTAIVPITWKPGLRGQIPILHLQTIFLWTAKCDPSQSGWVLRKWNSSPNKFVDPSWFKTKQKEPLGNMHICCSYILKTLFYSVIRKWFSWLIQCSKECSSP